MLLNLIAFQIGWWASVLGAAHGQPWLGPLGAAGVLALHLLIRPNRGAELLTVVSVAGTGYACDSLLSAVGLLRFENGAALRALCPAWMAALWICFATTPNVLFRWLRGRTIWSVWLGAVSGPLAYAAGQSIGALHWHASGWATGLALAIQWAILLPASVAMGAAFESRFATFPYPRARGSLPPSSSE